jgi:hypothetical protein
MVGVKHAFTSPKSDGADATLVRPTNWNDDHVVTDLVVGGLVAWQADEAITIAVNTDNQAVGASTAVIRMTATGAARNLTGLTGGADGRNLLLLNVGTFDIVLIHDLTSTAANRFLVPNATNFALPPNSGVHLVYDSTASRWRLTSQVNLASTTPGAIGTAAVGAGTTAARGDHVHASGAGTPSTQAFGDAAATGAGPAAAMTDHKHAMPADPVTAHAAAGDPHTGYRLESADHNHQSTGLQSGQLDHGLALTGLSDDDHPQYQKEADWTAKGDLMSASGVGVTARLGVGADDTILMADAAAATGLKWVASATPSTQAFGDAAAAGTADTFTRGDHKHAMPADPVTNHAAAADPHTVYVLESLFTAKGTIITASAASTPSALAVGADDTILMADAAAAGGLKWVASQVPTTETFGQAASQGTADTYARGDHAHGVPADPVTAHAAAGDPHTGYRLESADHTHASTGLQAGTIAHSVLTGLTNDEHTQYVLEATAGITGTLAVSGDITDTSVGAQNDWAPTGIGTATVVRWNGASAMTLSGITTGADGRVLLLMNVATAAANTITLVHDLTSTAANRFYIPSATNYVIPRFGAVLLVYDSTSSRWRVMEGVMLTNTQPTPDGTVSAGTALEAARYDHVHQSTPFSVDFSKGGTLAVGAGTFRWYNRTGRTLTFDSVTASVGTAPTGASVIIDVNKGGTTIYTTQANRPTIAVSTNTIDDTTAPNVTTVADNEYLTIDIDQVGSTVAGADLTVQVMLRT